jgi:hypothetical protein
VRYLTIPSLPCLLFLQRRKLGPIDWASTSSLHRQEWANLSNQQRLQEEADLRLVRRVQLEMLQCSNESQTAEIAMCLSTAADSAGAAQDNPPRELAKQVLESEVIPQVLCLDVNLQAEVRHKRCWPCCCSPALHAVASNHDNHAVHAGCPCFGVVHACRYIALH